MDTHISPAADAAREQSRQVDGRFGEQPFNRASTVQLTAPSDAVTSEGYDPQDVDFGLDSVNRCVAWYERDDNRTHIDVTCNVGASDLMGIPELASDDPRFEEGAVMLRELLEDRYPSAYLNTHTDEWEIQFTAEREGQSNLTDIVQSAWNDREPSHSTTNPTRERTARHHSTACSGTGRGGVSSLRAPGSRSKPATSTISMRSIGTRRVGQRPCLPTRTHGSTPGS